MRRNALKHTFVATIILLIADSTHAQPWQWDFGTAVDSCTQGISTSFLPVPPSGSARVRIGTQGGGVYLRNPGCPQLGANTEITLAAPSGGSLNKVQLCDYTSGSSLTLRFAFQLDAGPGEFSFFAGNGSCFHDNGGFTTAEIFTGLRFRVDSTGAVETAVRDASSWTVISSLTLQTGSTYTLEIYCNNGTGSRSYMHDSLCSVGPQRLDLWINDVRVASGASKAGLPDTSMIDSFMWYAADSPTRTALLSVDDLHFENAIASQPLPVELGSFRGCLRDGAVELSWTTVTELNNHGFTVERRIEHSGSWEERGFVPGVGCSAVPRQYSFRDSGWITEGTHLYRLRQTDRDGTQSFTAPVSIVVRSARSSFTLGTPYPSPAREGAVLPLTTVRDVTVSVRVYTLTGELVAEALPRRLLPAGEHALPLPCAAWPRGVLLCAVRAENALRVRPLLLR